MHYADDVILLCPSIMSLKKQLNVCAKFATEHRVKFNPSKTKLIECGDATGSSDYTEVTFMNSTLTWVTHDVHIDSLIGNVSGKDRVQNFVRNFNTKVMKLTQMSFQKPSCMYHVFPFQVALYAALQLQPMGSDSFANAFFVSWRKSV